MKKTKLDNREVKKANRALKRLMIRTLNSKKGGKSNKILNNITGKLRKNIKPLLYIQDNILMMDMKVMEYYQYLDEGTKRIKNPWFLTEEFTSSKGYRRVIKKLMKKTIESSIFDVISTNN